MQFALNDGAVEIARLIQCPICLEAIRVKPVQIRSCRCKPKYTYCGPCLDRTFGGGYTANCPFCRDTFLKADINKIDESYIQTLIKVFWTTVIVRSDPFVLTQEETRSQYENLVDKSQKFIIVKRFAIDLFTEQLEKIKVQNASNVIMNVLEVGAAALYLFPPLISLAVAGSLVVNGVDLIIAVTQCLDGIDIDERFQEIDKEATKLVNDPDVHAFLAKFESSVKKGGDSQTPLIKSIQGIKNAFTISRKVANAATGAKILLEAVNTVAHSKLITTPTWVFWSGLVLRVTISTFEYGFGIKRENFLRDAIKTLDDDIKNLQFYVETFDESLRINSLI